MRLQPVTSLSFWQRLRNISNPAAGHPLFARIGNRLFWPVVALGLSLVALIITAAISLQENTWLSGVLLVSSLIAAGALALLLYRLITRAHRPLDEISSWASQLRQGNLSTRLPANSIDSDLPGLSSDLNELGDELRSLNLEMSTRVRRHTRHLARKTRSLEILYDIASTLSKTRTLEELLENFLDTFVQLFDARAAMVRLVTDHGTLQLVASRGLDPEVIEREKFMPLNRCLCGQTATTGNVEIQKGADACKAVLGIPLLQQDCHEFVSVPIQYHDQTLGVYNLVLDKPISDFGDDLSDLLTSIGRHLGMAVEKARLDDNARRLAIIEERNTIGNELHDSLAQSLVSMRLHVKMLGEMLYKKDIHSAQMEVRRLHLALEEAHTSLRELLANFRSRMDERGLVPAIEDMVMRFSEETGIATYFQNECGEVVLEPAREIQVFRIIQEALANIRKHSDAHTARIMLRSETPDLHLLLIEDDGLGINPSAPPQRGEHIGLAIMRERAERLNGNLQIESEPGEGTRISLTFSTTAGRHLPAVQEG
ncbi:MAG TPA: histidine kinase [Gammaproteobacteria bacterium]|nr:histidine kinase [Gammaproteobacteria bacterium]